MPLSSGEAKKLFSEKIILMFKDIYCDWMALEILQSIVTKMFLSQPMQQNTESNLNRYRMPIYNISKLDNFTLYFICFSLKWYLSD